MTAVGPAALPQIYTPSTPSQTLLANNHDQRHADLQDEERALWTKLGLGASTPVANTFLRGTGTGTTAYQKSTAADVANEAWTAFTPTLTQSGSVAITVTYARFLKVGNTAHVQIMVAATAAGTIANVIVVGGLPGAIAPLQTGSSRHCGTALTVIGSIHRVVAVVPLTTSTLQFMGYGTSNYLGVDPSVALANADTIAMTLMYETS